MGDISLGAGLAVFWLCGVVVMAWVAWYERRALLLRHWGDWAHLAIVVLGGWGTVAIMGWGALQDWRAGRG